MAMGTALLGLLAFLLGCSDSSTEARNSERLATETCDLTGNWTNELTSTMWIKSVDNAGVFSGVYLTAVSDSISPPKSSPLQGVQHQGNQRAQSTFGFTVNWSFADSTSVFVGQCFQDENGEEELKTTWLLRQAEKSKKDDWKGTRVGTDTFFRI